MSKKIIAYGAMIVGIIAFSSALGSSIGIAIYVFNIFPGNFSNHFVNENKVKFKEEFCSKLAMPMSTTSRTSRTSTTSTTSIASKPGDLK